jgi:PEP-CTERM motif
MTPDGIGSAPSSSFNSGGSFIAGLTAPNAGFLAGAFVGSTLSTTTPSALDFTGAGKAAFASLSPELQQAFFIGDGLTGDGTGTTQTFYVPTGATTLYLGISDACGYSGGPSCYDDNGGSFTVNYTGATAGVPEPATWAMFLLGFGAIGWTLRKARSKGAVAATA